MGACLASMGQTDSARAAFETSLKLDPREAGTYANLATLELHSGNPGRAEDYFSIALIIDPNNRVAQDGLASLTSNPSR
jgi:Flp pilus assembly protein TadD